jgi:predicted ATP-dependent endonuclease of OLD family
MKLVRATVGPFRSINEPQAVSIDPEVTVLVGMNEAGKTVFLKALHKAKDALGKEVFNITDDYPRERCHHIQEASRRGTGRRG